jgi:hypothetical protein
MSLTAPFDILADWPGWTTEFDLLWRKETSRQANGVTRVKDFGTPLWRLAATTRSLSPSGLDAWRARLNAMDGGEQTFKGYSLSRTYPIAYPRGSWPTGVAFDGTTAAVHTIGTDNKSLRIDSLPAAFVLSVGDYVSVTAASGKVYLLQVVEAATASVGGLTPAFEVRPHLPVGIAVDNLVSVKRPHCPMTIVPGSISSTADPSNGRGTISFQAIEARDYVSPG